MLLSDYIWGRGKGLELSLWWYAPFNRIIPPHLHISAERLESKNFLFSLSPPASISISFGDAWLDRRLTYASHNADESFYFHPAPSFIIFVLEDSEEHKREKEKERERNRFDSFSRFPQMHLKRTIIFPLFIFASDRGDLSLCLKCIIFSNDATPLQPQHLFTRSFLSPLFSLFFSPLPKVGLMQGALWPRADWKLFLSSHLYWKVNTIYFNSDSTV